MMCEQPGWMSPGGAWCELSDGHEGDHAAPSLGTEWPARLGFDSTEEYEDAFWNNFAGEDHDPSS